MRNAFVNALIKQAKIDDRIFVITPDMGYSVLEKFQEEFPDRFLNVGIAEQNAISIAAGLALSGKVVYVYSIIPFITMRCFEQIRIDMAYMNTNVRIVGVGAGFTYGQLGATHHSIEDIAIMRALPNMTVCCPGDPFEAEMLIKESFDYQGPIYFRLGKKGEPVFNEKKKEIRIGKSSVIKEGNDIAIITTSNMLEQGYSWAMDFEKEGKNTSLISMHTIKPLDKEKVLEIIEKGMTIISLEEHSIIGGLGSALSEIIAESGRSVNFRKIGIPDQYTHKVGSQNFLKHYYQLDQKVKL